MATYLPSDHPLVSFFDLEEEERLIAPYKIERMSSLFLMRAKRRAVLLSGHLVNEEGKLEGVAETISFLKQWGYLSSPEGSDDGEITDHFLRVLSTLLAEKELLHMLQSFTLPLVDPSFEQMIQITLGLEERLTHQHLIRGLLSALLTPLRQSVGSCFATAPAILIHEEQMITWMGDLKEILYKRQLTRILNGVEFMVPASPSPGLGDLKKPYKENIPAFTRAMEKVGVETWEDPSQSFWEVLTTSVRHHLHLSEADFHRPPTRAHPKLHKIEECEDLIQLAQWHFVAFADHLLLKVWEFTIASFTDVKTEFSGWNLSTSLGLHPDEKGGIGELIYHHLQERLDEANRKLAESQTEYEISFDHVRATERMLGNAGSEQEVRRLRSELQARVYHFHSCEEIRDKWHEKGQRIAQFFEHLLEAYMAKFPLYFQEVYDGEMHEIKGDMYDDSPAGFRLMFKHGRAHTSSWTFIYTKEEYLQALREFFQAVEQPLKDECEWKEGKEEVTLLTTAILHHLMNDAFLISAFFRMAKAHQVPLKKMSLDDLEQMEKKPWAYTSGGTLPTLLRTYFRRDGSLTFESRWVESPLDLLVFFADLLKRLPPFVADSFLKNPHKRLLATSPSHVFSIFPGAPLFRDGWQDPGFTYTWVRDQIVLPRSHFYAALRLTEEHQVALVKLIASRLPLLVAHEFARHVDTSKKPIHLSAFYQTLYPLLPFAFQTTIDSVFYEELPFVDPQKADIICDKLQIPLPSRFGPLGRLSFHRYLVEEIVKTKRGSSEKEEVHAFVAYLMEQTHLSPPRPLVFADTNWAKYSFTFLVNPGTRELEFWRTDGLGLTGAPMREWEEHLNGSSQKAWGLYLYPYEYSAR